MPLDDLIREALAIEAEAARQAGALGFMARSLVQASLPHKKPTGVEFARTNGTFTLSMWAPSKVGLPYGSIPRMLMAWLTTEAVRTKERHLTLGDTLSSFMRTLDMVPTGGRWGTITRLREQSRRLFTTSISCFYEDEHRQSEVGFRVADKHTLWWEPKDPEQTSLFDSYVVLSETFFKEVIANPVPVDMRALKALKKSPLSIDIYCWLTHRMSYLKDPIEIPWPALQLQFGADYANHAHGVRDFKRAFLRELRKVRALYSHAKVEDGKWGLLLKPSKPHISAKNS